MVNDWIECSITDVLKTNGIKIGPFGSQLKKELLVSQGEYKVYGQENVYEKNFKLGDRFLVKEHFEKLESCEICPGDFLMSTMGTIGKCAIVPEGIQKGIMDSHLIRLRFDDNTVNKEYLLHLFSDQFNYLRDQTSRLSVGGIMDGLSVGIVSSLNVLFPKSKSEQAEITKTLSEIDDLIASLEKLIEKKNAIKQGAMQELLTGKKRLPGFEGEWNKYTLEQLCYLITKQTGFDYSAEIKPSLVTSKLSGTIPFIQNKDFEGFSINYDTDFYIPYNVAIKYPKILLDEVCLLISISGRIGNVAVFDNEYIAFAGGAVGIAKLKDTSMAEWCMLYLLSDDGQKQIFSHEKVGAQHNLTVEDVRILEIRIPEEKERQSIIEILSDMESEIEQLKGKLAKYRQIKQGMMSELLTGKIRLI